MLDRKLKHYDKLMARLEAAETHLISRAIRLHSRSGTLVDPHNKRELVRLPYSRIRWIASIVPLGEKVDLICHYHREIARLNIEIAEEQDPACQNKYLHLAFIQFE